jgi:Uma2 family endonuclease
MGAWPQSARRSDARDLSVPAAKVTGPPLLAVEVRSPSTALIALNRKKAADEAFGVAS